MNSKLKPPGTKRLKLKHDILLSNVAFKFALRRYIEVQQLSADKGVQLLSEVGIAAQRQPRHLHHMRTLTSPRNCFICVCGCFSRVVAHGVFRFPLHLGAGGGVLRYGS